MFGYLDLNSYITFLPNRFNKNYNPALMISPQGLSKGGEYVFDLFYKVFPRPRYSYPDILRWYLQNVYSTNPLSAGIVTLPKDLPHKTLASPGGVTFCWPRFSMPGSFPDYLSPELAGDDEYHDAAEDAYLKTHLTHLWFAGGRVHEVYPQAKTENARMLDENIRHLQNKGLKVYLYFRQLYRLEDFFDDKPPYKKWIARKKNGDTIPYDYTNPDGPWILADFANPDFVNWYVQDVKRTVELYNPDGVAWDMTWSDQAFGSSVNGSLHHGILRAIYEIHKWFGEKYPDKRVIGNGSRGLISQLYIDALLYEGSYAIDRTAAIARIFNNTLLNVGYSERYKRDYGEEKYRQKHIQGLMKDLSYGVTFGDRGYTMVNYDGSLRQQWQKRMGEGVITAEGLAGSSAYLLELTDFTGFSAQTSCIPLVSEEDALKILPKTDRITASVWADKNKFLLAVFNDDNTGREVTVRIDKTTIRKYGLMNFDPITFKVLASNGKPLPVDNWTVISDKDDRLVIRGFLNSKELLMADRSKER